MTIVFYLLSFWFTISCSQSFLSFLYSIATPEYKNPSFYEKCLIKKVISLAIHTILSLPLLIFFFIHIGLSQITLPIIGCFILIFNVFSLFTMGYIGFKHITD